MRANGSGCVRVLGICGNSGSGKTTLIEQLVPRLLLSGFSVAVVKHDAHRLQVDTPGKDSDRLFRAGADVVAHDSEQTFVRLHSGEMDVFGAASCLPSKYDLILVEGHKGSHAPKIWLLGEDEDGPPNEAQKVLAILRRSENIVDQAEELIREFIGKPAE